MYVLKKLNAKGGLKPEFLKLNDGDLSTKELLLRKTPYYEKNINSTEINVSM